jgi:hypothetical protein
VTIAARDLPVGAARSLAAARPYAAFDLVGFHWRGSGRVEFRTRGVDGHWSAWRVVDDDDHAASKVHLGEPYWVGPSNDLDYRVRGGVRWLRAFTLWSPVGPVPARTETIAGSPPIVTRAMWGANESIVRKKPKIAPAIHFAVVHHTAGTNAYSPAQSAAIVRGIEVYHVKGNGWDDIGYNFLVDRYGQVFEGRAGGITQNVVGAHAQGFNRGSVGVAVIGSYSTRAPTAAAQQALVSVLAWRLDVAHVDPQSTLTWLSGGNPRFPAGSPVFLRAISGHRDTGFTDCPGTALYRLLPSIATRVASTGLPKLYEPSVDGNLGGPVQFTGRLSSALPWTITIASGGELVARGSGTGPDISWTWDSTGVARGRYTWTMEAGSQVRPASGTIGTGPPVAPPPPAPPPPPPAPLVGALGVNPSVISPNGDGFADTGTVSYTLSKKSAVTAVVQDASGQIVKTLFSSQVQSARTISFPLAVDDLSDGQYALNVAATATDGTGGASTFPFLVDRTLSGLTANPSPLAPGGSITFAFGLAKPAQVTVTVLQNGAPLQVVFEGPLQAGPQAIGWNGQLASGQAPAGHYDVQVVAVDDVGQTAQTAGFDVAAPSG